MTAVERGRLHGAAFEALIEELAQIARGACGKKPDRAALAESVGGALAFFGAFPDYRPPSPLREYARPIADVLKLLRGEELVADQAALIEGLEQLECTVNPFLRPRGKGRPGNDELWLLVHALASTWTDATGKPFTQAWNRKAPQSPGAQFVYAAVSFLDPSLLHALPKMTERIVAERRNGKRWATCAGGISGVTSGK